MTHATRASMAEARSTETRTLLLRAGLQLFSRGGIDGVRTRQLAEAAGTNQSAIPYHFGGKQGLYVAVLEQAAGDIADSLRLPQRWARTQATAQRQLHEVMARFVVALLDSEDATARSQLLAREQVQPTIAYEALHRILFAPLHQGVSQLVGCIRRQPAAAPATVLRAQAILGQAIVFAVSRETLRRRLAQTETAAYEAGMLGPLVGSMAVAAASA